MKVKLRKRVARYIRRQFEWPVFCLIAFFATRCPRPRLLRFAKRWGPIATRIFRGERRVAAANLEIVCRGRKLSAKRRKLLIDAASAHAAKVVFDFFWFSRDGRNRLTEWCALDPKFRDWLSTNKGGIIVAGHLGNWETGAQIVAVSGFPLTSVAKKFGSDGTTRRIIALRQQFGQNIIMTDGAVKGIVRALKAEEFVALLLDQHTPIERGGTWVEFFGRWATISAAASRIGIKMGKEIAICFNQAYPNGKYVCHFVGSFKPWEFEDADAATQHIASTIESLIRKHPTQWLLSYKRWKYFPVDDERARYPYYAKPYPPDFIIARMPERKRIAEENYGSN